MMIENKMPLSEIVREIIREEVSALLKAQPKEIQIHSVFAPEINDFNALSYSHSELIKHINEVLIPIIQCHHAVLKNLCGERGDLVHLLEQPSEES